MSESIESMQRPPLEVVELPTEQLKPDSMNPNHVDDRRMEALRRDIVERGFVQPVVVRPEGSAYRIIDGEHRWRILQELKVEKTPCVVDDAGEDEGRLRLLTLNGLRGRSHPVKLGNLLARLAKDLSEEELQERLGMPPEEYEAVLALKDTPDLDAALAKQLEREEADAPEVLRWKMGPRQAQQLESAIDSLTETGLSRAGALIKILEGKGA